MNRSVPRRSLGVLVLALACLISPVIVASEKSDGLAPEKTPQLVLKTLDGKKFDLSKHVGDVVIVDFWATWCPPCVKEIPDFVKLHKKYEKKGLVIVGVSMDKSDGPVKTFVKDQKVRYPIVMNGGDVWKEFQELLPEKQRGGIPATFIVRRDGGIEEMMVGYHDAKTFENAVKPLLAQKFDKKKTGNDAVGAGAGAGR